MEAITNEEKHLIVSALNAMWHDAHEKLQRKDLGDIERKGCEHAKEKTKNLINKLAG